MQDNNIVALFYERSECAIKETKLKYENPIRIFLMRILGNESDARECKNNTYQVLKKYQFQYEDKGNQEVDLSMEELVEQLSEQSCSFSDAELSEVINSFLAGLNAKMRRVFMLRYWYHLTVEEIMTECNMNRSKVESILYHTREKLKKYIEVCEKRYWKN